MAKQTVVYTVVTIVDYKDELNWKSDVRSIRNTIKEIINSKPGIKIKSIDSKVVKE